MSLFANYGRNTRIGKRRLTIAERANRPSRWPEERIFRLCDLIADGMSFGQAADVLGVSRNAVCGQFSRIRASFGEQAA